MEHLSAEEKRMYLIRYSTSTVVEVNPFYYNCQLIITGCYYYYVNYSHSFYQINNNVLSWRALLNIILGSTVVSPYVGMARKQNGGYNASISVQTLIFHLVVNSTRLKTVRSALWRCPNSTVALRLLENVVKVTNLEVVKIEFRHLPILLILLLLSSSSSASLAP